MGVVPYLKFSFLSNFSILTLLLISRILWTVPKIFVLFQTSAVKRQIVILEAISTEFVLLASVFAMLGST